MKQCPKCEKVYDDSWQVCLNDSSRLVEPKPDFQTRIKEDEKILVERIAQDIKSDTKKCPDCAETIKKEAYVCRFCGKKQGKLEAISEGLDAASNVFKSLSSLAFLIGLLAFIILIYLRFKG